jgi:hypothetical protein
MRIFSLAMCLAGLLALLLAMVAFSSVRPRIPPAKGLADIERIFCINLEREATRKAHMEDLFARLGWRHLVEWVVPVEAPTGEASLLRTHMLLLERIAASQRRTAWTLVFEDDAELARGVSPAEGKALLERGLGELSPEGPHVTMGACLKDAADDALCCSEGCVSWCTHALAFTPPRARAVLRALRGAVGPIDGLLRVRCPPPTIVGHEFRHDHEHPFWRGLFFQHRSAAWYQGSSVTAILCNTASEKSAHANNPSTRAISDSEATLSPLGIGANPSFGQSTAAFCIFKIADLPPP